MNWESVQDAENHLQFKLQINTIRLLFFKICAKNRQPLPTERICQTNARDHLLDSK